jgi:predicted O-methyltransferase YrrM
MKQLKNLIALFGIRKLLFAIRKYLAHHRANRFGIYWTRIIPQQSLNPNLSEQNLKLAISFINSSPNQDLSDIANRSKSMQHLEYLNIWPGEHYKLLRGISSVIKPRLSVEIGTWVGMSTLALARFSEKTISYDIRSWKSFKKSFLLESDFENRIEHRVGDLTEEKFFENESHVFANADLIFLDGPKDGVFEEKFLKLSLPFFKPGAILILDDIKFLNMLEIWENLNYQRIDLSSFGHATGTGIVFIE